MRSRFWFVQLCLKLSGALKFSISNFLSILGLSVGVGTLLVALSLVDAYENSYKDSVFSIYSHAILTPLKSDMKFQDLEKDLKEVLGKNKFKVSPFLRQEGLLASKGKVSGVNIEGVEKETITSVIDLKSKIIKGKLLIEDKEKNAPALIGKNLAERFELKPGDIFAVVIPIKLSNSDQELSRKVFTFKLAGVLDYGSHFVNKRNIVVHKNVVSRMVGVSEDLFSAARVKLKNDSLLDFFVNKFRQQHDESYWIRSWTEAAGGLLKVIKFEKMIIFLVVLILALVASFNVSTNLFLNLVQKTRELSVLMTIGMNRKQIFLMLVFNGFFIAMMGIFLGTILSLVVISIINYILQSGLFVPPEVYKLTSIHLSLSPQALLMVSIAAIFLCLLASIAPARTIKSFSIIKGLRYD